MDEFNNYSVERMNAASACGFDWINLFLGRVYTAVPYLCVPVCWCVLVWCIVCLGLALGCVLCVFDVSLLCLHVHGRGDDRKRGRGRGDEGIPNDLIG